jgi:hypothetical protein
MADRSVTRASREALVALARAHAAAEGSGDMEGTLATLEPDPCYELQPVGLAFRGMPAARLFYMHFFSRFQPLIAGYELLSEWVGDGGVAQEYRIDLRFPDGREESHRVIGILTFGPRALSGERVFASERLLRLMFGPAYEQATPLGRG